VQAYIECSAKENDNVADLFQTIAKEVLSFRKKIKQNPVQDDIQLGDKSENKSSACSC
jgi:GTPase SAR1 family protein